MTTLQEVEDLYISKQVDLFKCLYTIWNEVGVDEDQRVNRAKQVWGYIFDVLEEIAKEEKGLFEDIKERVKNYEEKITKISAELDLPSGEEIAGTLIFREENLRQRLDELNKMKHSRLKKFHQLQSLETSYCKILGMPSHNLSSTTGVPSEKDIYELQQHVDMLKEEKEHRQKKFIMLKKELTTILEITELTPETPLETKILSNKEDSISLSNETLKMCEEILKKRKLEKTELENKKAVLMDKLFVLWDILKVDKQEREKFLAEHTDCCVSTINAIEKEIDRCENVKKQNIAKYIDALKNERLSLFEKCFIAQSEKKLSLFDANEVNETVLEYYDNEVAKLRKYYKDTEHIIKKINKRRELWNLMTVFENKANDPNRFKNRGGNLLKEERERKKLQKDLPNLENEIFQDIETYEEASGKQFLYFGGDFRSYVSKEWEDRLAQKENEKLMRQKLRSKQIDDGQLLGSTLSKRPYPAATPRSAPSKLFKSNAGMSVFKTPTFSSTSRPAASTVSKVRTRQLRSSAKKVESKVLQEKNENKPEGSDCLDSTTYTAFAEKLERSSRYAHRSSVLSCKKVGGTRISLNKSKRKSVNKSLQKSIRKKDSTKITPARGKLGLPFLI